MSIEKKIVKKMDLACSNCGSTATYIEVWLKKQEEKGKTHVYVFCKACDEKIFSL